MPGSARCSSALCLFFVIFTIAIALLMTWKDDEKAYAVKTFFKTGSYVQTMLSFRKRFNVLKSPNKTRIAHWVKKFRIEGTVKNLNSGRIGRRRHGSSQENIDIVSASVDASPDTSIRRRIFSLDIDSIVCIYIQHELQAQPSSAVVPVSWFRWH